MALETATYINQLDAANPLGSDPIASGDDHLRLIKSTLKATFPNITGAVTKTQTDINNLATQSDLSTLQSTLSAAMTSAIDTAVSNTKDALYPIGSIYTNATNATNPGTLLGFGTWVSFGAGKVLVGVDSGDTLFSAAGNIGGSKDATVVSHTHTASQAAHYHSYRDRYYVEAGSVLSPASYKESMPSGYNAGYGSNGTDTDNNTWLFYDSNTGNASPSISVDAAGSSGTNANLQPYITVYMWKRTA